MPVQVHPCPICQSESGLPRIVREILLGTGEEFLYFECQDCGCLFLAGESSSIDQSGPPSEWTAEVRPSRLLRRVVAALHVWPAYIKAVCIGRADLEILQRVQLTRETTLLDVGPGAAARADALQKLGYDAHCIDISTRDSLAEVSEMFTGRQWPDNIPKRFDLILLRHSLERLPCETLSLAREHINVNGCCVACVVLMGWAWRTYGTHWAQLNAPFHRLVHSGTSFSILAKKSDFRIDQVVFDSTESQIWNSDALQRNVPLTKIPVPSRSQRARMRRFADALNLRHQGDSAQFYLQPV